MKKFIVAVALMGTVLLAGCSFNASTEDDLTDILTDMHEAEHTYRESQEKLQSLEAEEQELFNQTMELSQEDQEQLADQVAKLNEKLAERMELVEKEETSMATAKAFLSEFEGLEEKAEVDSLTAIEKVRVAIIDRYDAHEQFISQYKELTALQKELYAFLLDEEMDAVQLNQQVELINEQNEAVIQSVENFNDLTNVLNQTQDEVYRFFEKE